MMSTSLPVFEANHQVQSAWVDFNLINVEGMVT